MKIIRNSFLAISIAAMLPLSAFSQTPDSAVKALAETINKAAGALPGPAVPSAPLVDPTSSSAEPQAAPADSATAADGKTRRELELFAREKKKKDSENKRKARKEELGKRKAERLAKRAERKAASEARKAKRAARLKPLDTSSSSSSSTNSK